MLKPTTIKHDNDVIDELAKDIDEHCEFERAKVVSQDGGAEEHYSRTNKVAKNSLEYNKSEAARKFLKIAYDKIQEMKSNLKGEELETFLSAYHIKLILNEWEKINN